MTHSKPRSFASRIVVCTQTSVVIPVRTMLRMPRVFRISSRSVAQNDPLPGLSMIDITADLAIVFEPVRLSEFQILLTIRQPVHAVMRPDHPLAGQKTLRLRDCLQYPIALPTAPYGVRHLMELAVRRTSLTLQPELESDSFEFLRYYARSENILSFQLPIGLAPNADDDGTVSRPIDTRDVPEGFLYFGQLRGRTLPVAAARFAQQMQETFIRRFDCE
jgi:hypothetical protein